MDALTALLHEDATWSMPPYELWLQTHRGHRSWCLGPGIGCRGSRLIPTMANGSPAFGQYKPDPDGGWEPWSLQVLELDRTDADRRDHVLPRHRAVLPAVRATAPGSTPDPADDARHARSARPASSSSSRSSGDACVEPDVGDRGRRAASARRASASTVAEVGVRERRARRRRRRPSAVRE